MTLVELPRLKPKRRDGLWRLPGVGRRVLRFCAPAPLRLWIVLAAAAAIVGGVGPSKVGTAISLPAEAEGVDEPARARGVPRDTLPVDLFDRPVPLGLLDAAQQKSSTLAAGRADGDRLRARFDLGRSLFFDPRLSIDHTVACATCHRPEHGFASPDSRSVGVLGRVTKRHAPTLFNRRFGEYQSWDGQAATLEEQALLPIANPLEMGLPIDEALARIREDVALRGRFEEAFEDGVSERNLGVALAEFMGRLYSGGSRVDRFVNAREAALSPAEKAGLWIYESKGRCWTCHSGRNYTDEAFHNTGVGVVDGKPEPGRFAVTGLEEDRGAFKTPTLRGVALHPPYMHDGSLATLRDVVEFYRRGGNSNDRLDRKLRPLDLTDRDVDHLVAFLEALSEQ